MKNKFYAGISSYQFLQIAWGGKCHGVFSSFYYYFTGLADRRFEMAKILKSPEYRICNDLRYRERKDTILDSGLFSLLFGAGKTMGAEVVDRYCDFYFDFLSNSGYTGKFVELDLQNLKGIKETQIWRDRFEDAFGWERGMVVWHHIDGKDGMKHMAERYPYVAISVPELKKRYGTRGASYYASDLIDIAKEANSDVQLHMLGCCQASFLGRNMEWDTCDSTSWMAPGAWGRLAALVGENISKMKSTVDIDINQLKKLTSEAHFQQYLRDLDEYRNLFFDGKPDGCRETYCYSDAIACDSVVNSLALARKVYDKDNSRFELVGEIG